MAAEPLQRNINSILFSDDEIRRITANASKEAKKIMASLAGKEGVAAAARRARAELADIMAGIWKDTHDITKISIADAVWNATEYQSLIDEGMFQASGLSQRYWRQALIAQAQAGVDALISRKENGYTLSQTVYKNAALSKGYVDRAVNNGLLLGKSAREISKDVVGFIDPAVPGGASYAAMRLARTEINNAYHTTSINNYKKTPWVNACKWNLSGSHKKPDQCNEYADNEYKKGMGAGVWPLSQVPGRPHPNCLCYVTPIVESLDAFVKNFNSHKYDDYIDGTLGCASVA